MPSFQNSAPGSKSEKFVDGLNNSNNVNNIFAPFLAEPGDLGGGTNNNDTAEPDPLSEFDTRLRLQEKRGQGGGGGGFIPNTQQYQQEPSNNNSVKKTNINDRPIYSINDNNENNNIEEETGDDDDDDDDSSEDYDYLLDDDIDDDGGGGDPVLAAIRQKRLNELKRQHIQIKEHKSKGHGEYRIITQDEFLPECTGSKWVLVNFFHDDFERCKIMDYHIKRIVPHHLKCKFVGVNAAKCPFFVQKLNVKTLPTLIVFRDGKAVDRLIGFDGLSNNPKKPDEFTTSSLGRWIESTKAIDEYLGPDDSDDEKEEENNNNNNNNKGRYQSRFHTYDEDH